MPPTHGSLTKAGKVRSQTPKLEGKPKRSKIPKVRNKRTYEKRFTLKRKPGQNWMRR
ncbi:MAG TPA: 30S ribosomal protein S30e [Nitrososphaerales archaeon]|nr:30S ribosomal protein S30e [Nitrososphaerales archaeon]